MSRKIQHDDKVESLGLIKSKRSSYAENKEPPNHKAVTPQSLNSYKSSTPSVLQTDYMHQKKASMALNIADTKAIYSNRSILSTADQQRSTSRMMGHRKYRTSS